MRSFLTLLETTAIGLTCVVVFVCLQAGATGFRVSGTFETTRPQGDGPVYAAAGCFTAVADSCNWRIRTTRFDEALDYVEAGSTNDGTIYLLASYSNTTHSAVAAIAPDKTFDIDFGFARIISGRVPHFDCGEHLCMVWLAYASGCYFATRTNNLIEPVYWFGGQYFFNQGLVLPGQWELAEAEPHLPSRVVYFNDGFIRAMNKEGLPAVIPNPPVYSKGYTNAEFQVLGYAHLGSWQVPNSFVLKIYSFKPSGSSQTDLMATRIISFTATNVQLLQASETFIPELQGKTTVTDFRLSRTNPLASYSYQISNRWPSVDTLLKSGVRPSISVAQNLGPNGTRKFIARTVLLFFVGTTLAVILTVTFKNSNKQRGKRKE